MTGNCNRCEHVLDLIGHFYDAVQDEKRWAGLSSAIAAICDAPSAQLQLRDNQTRFFGRLSLTSNYDAKSIASYATHYWQHDPWIKGARKFPLSTVLTNKDLVDEAELINSEIYQEYARHLGIFHLVGAAFAIENGQVGMIGIHRPRNTPAFDEADKALVSSFLPHLQRALQIRHRLLIPAIEEQAGREALDRTATAMLVIDRDGHVLFANRNAEQLIREADAIRSVGNRLAVAGRGANSRLSGLIRDAADTAAGRGCSAGGTLILERSERLPLTALVAPFRPGRDGFGVTMPAAILFIRDPEAQSPAGEALQALFGLTPAEARVASALADGQSLQEIATSVHVTLNTVRTQVRSILAKTNTLRQSQLVGLLLRSVAVMTVVNQRKMLTRGGRPG